MIKMNEKPVASSLNAHCLVDKVLPSREIKDDTSESQPTSVSESTEESDSTADSDESETTKADSCREESVMDTDSCSQSRISSTNSTSKKVKTPRPRRRTNFFRIFKFFGRRKQKLIEEKITPEENEFEEKNSSKSITETNKEEYVDDQSVSKTSEKADIDEVFRNTRENDYDKSMNNANINTFQQSERSLVSKKIICCSTCSSPMVIHEILLASPQGNSTYHPNSPQYSRIYEDDEVIRDGSEKSLLEDAPNSETYIMEKSLSSEVISEDTESPKSQPKHPNSVEIPHNLAENSEVEEENFQKKVESIQNNVEILQKIADNSKLREEGTGIQINVVNEVQRLQTDNEVSEMVVEELKPEICLIPSNDSPNLQVDSKYTEKSSIINNSSRILSENDSEKVIAKIDYTENLSPSVSSTSSTSTSTDTKSTLILDKKDQTEAKTIITDKSESDETIVEDQFLISDQSFGSHNEKSKTVDRYSSFKKKYISVRSNCDTSSSLKSGPEEVPSNKCMTPFEKTDCLFYPRKFCASEETDKTQTIMWVSHHYPESPKKDDEKDAAVMNISTKKQDNSIRYCAPRDILEMTLGKYQTNTTNSIDIQKKSDTIDMREFESKSDSIQNIYLNKAFFNQSNLESNDKVSDEFEFPRDIKINGVLYRQFNRDYIPIKLKSEYKWKLFARRTIYSRSRKSVHSSKYSRINNSRNKEKSRKIYDKKYNDKIKSPSILSRVSLTESANDEEDCRTLKEQLSKISICLSDYSDE
ncbi:hypothetical protein LSTR_LSTR015033 [Laodelphax striatellus]|uniref:Uncharacterized protein n=1 Tax=Laodelphax striatellus TaxID=195883 RepID=A0A482XJ32_LAOST|nr:hypothetical protein LSTR_LSTR015033 [Laodelphax striatellus]